MTDTPQTEQPAPEVPNAQIKWCDGHWANLMFALKDQGLDQFVSPNKEILGQRLAEGLGDPCWQAFTNVNMAALQVFGPQKITERFHGCPVCAFSAIAEHAAESIAPSYLRKH